MRDGLVFCGVELLFLCIQGSYTIAQQLGVEELLNLKADWNNAKTALESTVSELQAKVTDLEAQVAQAAQNAEAAAEADVQALIAKIDAA